MATDTKLCAKKILIKSLVERTLCIDQIEASTSPPSPSGRSIPLSSRWGGNLIIRVFMEVENFEVGYLN